MCRVNSNWIINLFSVFSGTLNRVKYSTKSCSSSTMRQKWRRIGDIANSRRRSRRRRPAKVLPIKCYCYWWVLWTALRARGRRLLLSNRARKPSQKMDRSQRQSRCGYKFFRSGRDFKEWEKEELGLELPMSGRVEYIATRRTLCTTNCAHCAGPGTGMWTEGVRRWLWCSINSQSDLARRADGLCGVQNGYVGWVWGQLSSRGNSKNI